MRGNVGTGPCPATEPVTWPRMEEGTKTKKTIFVGGIGDDVDEAVILDNFATFGQCHVSFRGCRLLISSF